MRSCFVPICRIVLILTVFACCSLSAPAQTVYGPGGLFVHPTASIRERGTVGVNISYFTQRVNPATNTNSEWMPVSVTAGISPRFEAGVLYVRRRLGATIGDSGGLFAKYQIQPDTANRPALALVGSFLSGDVKQSSLSLAASHRFLHNNRELLTLHLGLQGALRSDLPAEQADAAFYFGVDAPIAPRLRFVGEYGTRFRFDRRSTSAVGVMWSVAKEVGIGVSYVNAGRGQESGFFVGVGYQIGGGKSQ